MNIQGTIKLPSHHKDMTINKVVIVYGGELANDVANQVEAKKPAGFTGDVELRNASERPKKLLENDQDALICFIIQTIENSAPTEEGGACMRFFKRKNHPDDLLKEKFTFAVFGLGDSNLLMDRQTTTANDCNQCAKELDLRLEALGGKRFHELGMTDERSGLKEVEPWIDSFWASLPN